MTVAAGSIVADGAKLEDILKKLLAEAEKNEPEAAKLIKLNAETYKGIRFDVFSMPAPDPKLAALVGDTLDVVLGIGDKQVFIAAGRDADKTLKEVIDKSQSEAGKEIPASQLVLSGLKIAKFVSAVADDDQAKAVADKIAAILEQSGGKDHLTMTTEPIHNGARVRLELEEGILKALGGMQPAWAVIGRINRRQADCRFSVNENRTVPLGLAPGEHARGFLSSMCHIKNGEFIV